MRRAGAWQADDEHRVADVLLLNARIVGALRFEAQQIVEQAHDEFARREAAECRQGRFIVIRLQ
jgi:hypothetical protein